MSYIVLTEADQAVVSSVARQLRSRYHGYVELADVQQELYIWLFAHMERVQEWREEHHPRTADRLLARSLRNYGEKFCRKQKAQYLGYEIDDEFFYSIQMVADILQLYFDPEYMMPGSIQLGQTSSGKPASEGGNLMAMVADVGKAYEAMPPVDQERLERVYGGHMPVRDAIQLEALEWDITYSAADKRIRRVLGRLRQKLGGQRPYEETA